jgi:hypothetical protein
MLKNDDNNKYFTRFNKIYVDPFVSFCNYLNGTTTLSDIGKLCKNGMIDCEFRPILYKILLNILPYDKPCSWKKLVKEQRETYYQKLNKLLSEDKNLLKFINCHEIKGTKIYEDLYCKLPESKKEIISLIKLDVDRTFQDLDLFHNNKVKELLTKILYVNSIENPDPSYCQGMNEILGTLFYAFLPSVRFNKYPKRQQDKENNNKITNLEMLYSYIVDEEHFEADLYTVYSELMSRDLTLLYTYNDDKYRSKNNSNNTYDLNNLTNEDLIKSEESDLLKRIKKIFYIYLKQDKSYFDFLSGNIEPNLFLLRWLLCMLDREISLKNVLWIWDCILFYEFVEFTVEKKQTKINGVNGMTNENNKYHVNRLNFLDYVCLSMIFDLKTNVINSESSVVLCKFLKFPNEKNIQSIMNKAFELAIDLNGGTDKWNNEKIKNGINFVKK